MKETKSRPKSEDDNFDYHVIDKYHLDDELEQHARRYRIAAERLADAEARLSHAEMLLEVTEAETAMAIRKNPKKFNIDRITDKSVKEAVILQREYQEARLRVIRRKKQVGYHKADVTGLSQKKGHIEKTCDLFLSGYYASPKHFGKPTSFDKRNERGKH